MDTLYLERFLIVAEHRNFTKAANQLFLSTSTVSKSVVYLEESLGVKLLNRTNQSVELTRCGKFLMERGRAIIDDINQLKTDLAFLEDQPGDTLNIYRIPISSPAFLSAYSSYSSKHPDDTIQIFTHTPVGVAKALRSGTTHAGLISDDPDPWLELGYCIKVIEEDDPFCAVVAKGHPLFRKKDITTRDLVGHRILNAGQSLSSFSRGTAKAHEELIAKLRMLKCEPVSFSNEETRTFQLRAGLGVDLMSRSAARELYPDMQHIEITDFDSDLEVFLIWNKNTENQALKSFTELLPELE